jgi:hypothetical protein
VAATVRKQNESSDKAEVDVQPQVEATLTKEAIKQAQVSDEFCRQINQALSEGKRIPYFRDKDSVLYYESPDVSGTKNRCSSVIKRASHSTAT